MKTAASLLLLILSFIFLISGILLSLYLLYIALALSLSSINMTLSIYTRREKARSVYGCLVSAGLTVFFLTLISLFFK